MRYLRIFALAIGALLFITIGARGQQNTEGRNNYVVITKKVQHFKPIALTSSALSAEDGKNFGEFKVVLYGPEVVQLTDRKKMKPIIKMARNSNLKLAVCGMALDRMNVDRNKVPKVFEIVDNAFLHSYQL